MDSGRIVISKDHTGFIGAERLRSEITRYYGNCDDLVMVIWLGGITARHRENIAVQPTVVIERTQRQFLIKRGEIREPARETSILVGGGILSLKVVQFPEPAHSSIFIGGPQVVGGTPILGNVLSKEAQRDHNYG